MKGNFLRKILALLLIAVTLSQSLPTLFMDIETNSAISLVLDIDLDNEAENESEKEKNKEVDEEKSKVRPSSFAFQLKTLRTKHSFLGRSVYFSSPSQDIFLPPPELKLYA